MQFIDLGLIQYDDALRRQKDLVREVAAGAEDVLIFCEHPLTLTLGRKTKLANLLLPRPELEHLGYTVYEADRGGDVTLHAPGQLVVYPILNLKKHGLDLLGYLRKLEQAAVDFLEDFDIVATGDEAKRGVWVGSAKIASIGIGVSRWVTFHGIAINVTNDLRDFRVIRPCGLDVAMTSLAKLLGKPVDPLRVRECAQKTFLTQLS